ncbi:MAG: hypothetical protein ISP82_03620 [Candidatus Poseidoniaceae archaeon]|nr:hypothetical protein [Candidatus Poseidoniaceae archaeon]MBL6896189.1 hypothetical protein [Candidatus Poseidoniaceae archaeon]
MRRSLVALVLVLCIFTPMVKNSAANLENGILELDSTTRHIIHRGETIEASITVRNIADQVNEISFQHALPDNISISSLPDEYELSEGQVRQFKFYFTCDDYAPYQTVNAVITITSSLDSQLSIDSEFDLVISKQSNLQYGVSGDSQFVVDPGIRTNLAVNMTNYGLFGDNVTFSLATNSDWQWGWTMNNTENLTSYEYFAANQLKYIYLWIEVPEVINSQPLFESGPRFSLVATSKLDECTTTWNFDLLMSEFRNVSIMEQETNLSLSPDSSGRTPVSITNVGNIENVVSIDLQVIDSQGNPIIGVPVSDRIDYNGWIIAVFGGYENEFIQPTNSRTFEIGFQSPNNNEGEINVRVIITPSGAANRAKYVDLQTAIVWQREVNADLISDDCSQLLPSDTCDASFRIYNDGNYQDNYLVEIIEQPNFVSLSLGTNSLEIGKNSFVDISSLTITANQDASAFANGNVIIAISLTNSNQNPVLINVDVVISPEISWSLQNLVEENDAIGRFNIAMTLRNDGNSMDGIIVQLQCSHFTEMSLIPPSEAIYESGIEYPRSFEINDIDLASNFTVRAWAEIPVDQISNGTMYLNVSIRSIFTPDEPIEFTTSVQYYGTNGQDDKVKTNEKTLGDYVEITTEIVKSWFWIIISILASGLIINKALRDRNDRLENQTMIDTLNSANTSEKQDDWLAKFDSKREETTTIESPEIASERFERSFKNRAGQLKPVTAPIDEKLRDAAALVLDAHDKTIVRNEADELLNAIDIGGIKQPVSDNEKLPAAQYNPKMTMRSDPRNILSDGEQIATEFTKSVPLPDDDDLDF